MLARPALDVAVILRKLRTQSRWKEWQWELEDVVENMAVHVCSNCGHAEHIFGEGGGKRYAHEKGIDYLGALPLAMKIREQADSGKPTVVADPDGEAANIYKDIARQVAIKIASKAKDFSSKFPTITVSKNT